MTSKLMCGAAALCVLLVGTTASARDTAVANLYRIDAKIVEALGKKKLNSTKHVREHFADKSNDKIKRWAKNKRLDQDAFLRVVFQCQIMGIKSMTAKAAYLVVNECHVHGLEPLSTVEKGWMAQCVNEKSEAGRVLSKPIDQAKVDGWIAAAKTFDGTATTKVAWARSVRIERFHRPAAAVQKAMLKAGMKTNLDVFEKLSRPKEREKFAKRKRIAIQQVKRYAAVSDLLRIEKVTPRVAELMWSAGFESAVGLKGLPAESLLAKLKAANDRERVMKKLPSIEDCKAFIEAAKPFKQHH